MKTVNLLSFVLILSLALVGCAADLAVRNLEVNWNETNKTAAVEIVNIGNRDAGEFLVYFNGDEFPVSPNHRPQVRHNVAGLNSGASITLEADFAPLAHPDNNNLGNVYQISVLADPKNMVSESNEENNVKRAPIIAPVVELYDKNDIIIPENPEPLTEVRLPVLFVHGHNLNNAMDQDSNYKKNWQDPLDYGNVLRLPSFKIALDLQQNSNLGIEPYYIRFQNQNRSIIEDAGEIGEAIERILKRHNDPEATQVKVVIIAYSKGTISTRWYLKNMMPDFQPVSEFIAISPPNHGLASPDEFQIGSATIRLSDSIALRQLNNGYHDNCNSFNETQSENFIETLNGHPIEDTLTDSEQRPQYNGEAPGSRPDSTPTNEGILYVILFANNNRDAVGGHTPSGDCQGRILAKNLAPNAVNIQVPEIPGLTKLGVHANTVHTPEVVCLALYTAIHHQAPPPDLSYTMEIVDGREVPIIP